MDKPGSGSKVDPDHVSIRLLNFFGSGYGDSSAPDPLLHHIQVVAGPGFSPDPLLHRIKGFSGPGFFPDPLLYRIQGVYGPGFSPDPLWLQISSGSGSALAFDLYSDPAGSSTSRQAEGGLWQSAILVPPPRALLSTLKSKSNFEAFK